jgi:N-acetylmuramoyl-L-alanine amidase
VARGKGGKERRLKSTRFGAVLLTLGLIALLPAPSASAADTEESGAVSVVSGGERWSLPVRVLDGARYVDLGELQRAIGGSVVREPGRMEAEFRYGGGSFRFVDGLPFFSWEERPYQLVDVPRLQRDRFLVPVQFPAEFLPYFFPDLFSWDPATYTLRDRRYDAFVRGLRRRAREGETVLFLHASVPPRFDVDASEPGVLRVNLFETQCRLALSDSIRAFGYVDSVVVRESDGSTQLRFHLKPSVRHYRVSEVRRPPGIRVVLTGATPPDGAAPKEPVDLLSGNMAPEQFRLRTVIIDPGHGGKDPGAIGKNGCREKDVTLAVALRLKSVLEERTDLRVVMTREDDTYVSLRDRTAIANRQQHGTPSTLFVSIHCNASKKRDLRGFEAYFLSEAKTDEERAVAFRENLSVRFDEPAIDDGARDDLDFILLDLTQNEFHRESNDWAGIMSREFADGSRIRSRGVRQAGFFVLNGARMPSILLELGYLSNPKEEKLLASEKYQAELVEQIFRGIRTYIDRYHRKIEG